MRKQSIFVFAAAPLALLAAGPAFAEAVAVTYEDLDLSTEQGRDKLEQRLDRAARQVCGLDDSRTGSRIRSKDASDCYKQARKQLTDSLAAATAQKASGG